MTKALSKPNFKLSLIAASFLIPNLLFGADVADSNNEITDNTFEVITVSATKTEREINEIAANVTAITSADIDAIGASDIRDMLRYEPGVSVEGSGRFGLSGFNIRGINGDRVLILLDGIPVADEFSFGPNLSSRRDFIDVDLIQSAEIIRGPASTLYGSDAIGGVIAFTSKQPSDLVDETNTTAVRAKLGYFSQANEYSANVQVAGLHNQWQWLLNAGYRNGDETETFFDDNILGSLRQSADPQQSNNKNALAKINYTINAEQQLTFTADIGEQNRDTHLLSEQGTMFRGIGTQSSKGFDESSRSRVSLQYRYQNPDSMLNKLAIRGFSQRSETTQVTDVMRAPVANPSAQQLRLRHSQFEQEVTGLHIQADQIFNWGGSHYLIYGLQWEQTHSESLRTGSTTILETGALVPEFSVFPARDFPISELNEFSLFLQDEISLFDSSFTISPGIRYDRFKLTPQQDAVFATANPGVVIAEFEDSEISAKLGTVYTLSPNTNIWWQYAEGFRIPPMDDVNVGFTNFAGGYTSLPNPNLKPERVISNEIGLRHSVDAFDLSISAYSNRYTDFIESRTAVGFNPATNLLEFQATNIGNVSIDGIDAQLNWYLGETFSGLYDWQLRLSTSLQESKNKATGAEIDSVLPAQSVIGVQYKSVDDPWRVELLATISAEANTVLNPDNEQTFFSAPSYVTWDLLMHYQLTESFRINAGLFNITNKRYWLASEVRGRDPEENLDRLTAAGRNFSLNVVMSF